MSQLDYMRCLYHTIRHLQLRQIVGQVRHRLHAKFDYPSQFAHKPAPPFSGCQWSHSRVFLPPVTSLNNYEDMIRGQMTFINQPQKIDWPPDWDRNDLSKLWLYNLHYFEYLWILDYNKSRSLVLDWIENYPLQKKHLGWEPYPTSLRLINLCSVFFGKFRKQIEADVLFHKKLWDSIYLQAEWITKHLETHLLGNHLFENAAALSFVGSCFKGYKAKKWLNKGIDILTDQISEQILPDGMHFELSPMYHCRIVYLLAMLAATGNEHLTQLITKSLSQMLKALDVVCHPDGRIALLNDSAFGIYNEPTELKLFCWELPVMTKPPLDIIHGCFALPDAGYYGWRNGDGTYVICDCGKIGPDYIPGHAHADIFSFEMSLKGHRIIVDAGVYDYEMSAFRRYCRGTSAHNTVEINGIDQCEMWGAFRVGKRGYPIDVTFTDREDGFELSGLYNGYKRLSGRPVHYRKFNWDKLAKLTVTDMVTASNSCSVVSRLHLHPDCRIDQIESNIVWVIYPAGKINITFSGNGTIRREDSFYCPEFGVKIPSMTIAYASFGQNIETTFQISLL